MRGDFTTNNSVVRQVRFQAMPGQHQVASVHPGWSMIANSIRTGKTLLKANDIQLVVLLVPMKIRVLAQFTELNGGSS
jgi:hypothetical protein